MSDNILAKFLVYLMMDHLCTLKVANKKTETLAHKNVAFPNTI